MDSMSTRTRWLVLLISTPLVVFIAVGGLLGASTAPRQGAAEHLRVFFDVISLIRDAYVEQPNTDRVMEGAMRGLVDALDPASAYLTPEEVKLAEANAPLPAAGVGLVVTRQFYLRVVGVRDGSPAARAGLRTGDFIRAVDGKATRDMSAFTGTRLLRGAPGTKVQVVVIRGNPADPHVIDLVREAPAGEAVSSKRLPGGAGYVRIASFAAGTAAAVRRHVDTLQKAGAPGIVIDVRRTADGELDEGIATARLFVKAGTIATRAGRGTDRTVTTAAAGDGSVALPVVLLVSNGTAGAAEVFAAALSGNSRSELVGEPTAGLAALQRLVKLPDSQGLWMTYARYLTVDGDPIHERGLRPTVGVEEPSVAFGEAPPAADEALNTAVARLKAKGA
jgi:carboxyl-terminal processing protease